MLSDEERKKHHKEANKRYSEKNPDKVLESARRSRVKNADHNRERRKIYYWNNKEKFQEYGKKYRKEHREEMLAYLKNYREAHQEEKKQYKIEHRDEILEYNRRHYIECHDEVLQQQKNYRYKNLEVCRERSRKWGKNNPEKVLEISRRNYDNHKEARLAYTKKRRSTLEGRVACAMYADRRRARKKNALTEDTTLFRKWVLTLPYIICPYCYEEVVPGTKDCHIDHMIPLSRGGPEAIWNLDAICARDNIQKRNRTPDEYLEYIKIRGQSWLAAQ